MIDVFTSLFATSNYEVRDIVDRICLRRSYDKDVVVLRMLASNMKWDTDKPVHTMRKSELCRWFRSNLGSPWFFQHMWNKWIPFSWLNSSRKIKEVMMKLKNLIINNKRIYLSLFYVESDYQEYIKEIENLSEFPLPRAYEEFDYVVSYMNNLILMMERILEGNTFFRKILTAGIGPTARKAKGLELENAKLVYDSIRKLRNHMRSFMRLIRKDDSFDDQMETMKKSKQVRKSNQYRSAELKQRKLANKIALFDAFGYAVEVDRRRRRH
jgi:uncharacterized protein YdcH (DUF465 family)